MSFRNALGVSLLALLFCFVGTASAKKPDAIHKAFNGKILISAEELPAPDPEDAKATIKAYRKANLDTIESTSDAGTASWYFYFTAFAKTKPKATTLALEFYTDDSEKLFVAEKRLNGADPSLQIISSKVSITEDDNLNRKRRYVVKLVARQGKKSVELASTKLATK